MLGAAAGAALLGRQGREKKEGADHDTENEDDFEARLETDENLRLISSRKVEGTPVIGSDGRRLGEIDSFMVDKYTGRVAYAVMRFGGTMGFGTSLFPLPWPLLEYDVSKDGYALEITEEQLADAPHFKSNESPEFDASYRSRVIRFYRRP